MGGSVIKVWRIIWMAPKSIVVGLEVTRKLIDEGEGHVVGFVDLRIDSIAAAAAAAAGRSTDIHDLEVTFQFFAFRYIRWKANIWLK